MKQIAAILLACILLLPACSNQNSVTPSGEPAPPAQAVSEAVSENGAYVTPYPSQTYDVYFALGHAGQFIYVAPELNMVTVFTSHCQSSYGPRPYFTDYVLNAHMG